MTLQPQRFGRPGLLRPRRTAKILLTLPQVATVGIFALALIYTLYFARALFVPISLALVISLVLRPLVRWLREVGIPSRISSLGILIVVFVALSGAVSALYRPAADWADRIPDISHTIEHKLWPIKKTIEEAKRASRDLERVAEVSKDRSQPVSLPTPSLLDRALGFTWTTIVQTLIVLVLSFFLLAEEGSSFSERTLRRLSPRLARSAAHSLALIEQNIGRYLTVLVVMNLTVGALAAAALALVGMPNPLLWGALSALLGLLPYIGPLVTMALLAAVSLTLFDDWIRSLIPVAVYALIHYSISELIVPLVVGRLLRVSPAAVFLSVLLWSWLWGVAGAFLAVPALVTLSAMFSAGFPPPENGRAPERPDMKKPDERS